MISIGTLTLTSTHLKMKVEDLGGIEQILTGNFSVAAGSISIIEPGLTLRSFYGYEVEGYLAGK